MTLADPFWLVLAIPLAMSLWLWRLPSRLLLALRCAALAALLLALCGLCVLLPVRSGTVVLVADRSLSMPPDSEALEKEAADSCTFGDGDRRQTGRRIVRRDGGGGAVACRPASSPAFPREVGREASRLADALDLALSLIGKDEPGRILVFSDGHWTGRDLSASAARAAAAGVAIDYRAMQRSSAGDLAIERIQAPESVLPGESFMITAWISSPLAAARSPTSCCRGYTGNRPRHRGRPLGHQPAALPRHGRRRRLPRIYVLRVEGEGAGSRPGQQPRPAAGRASAGRRPCFASIPARHPGLPGLLLRKGGLNVEPAAAVQCIGRWKSWPATRRCSWKTRPPASSATWECRTSSAWVTQSGGGLMLTGGRDSYGSGGYFKSPLDPLLPVSMELRREHRKLSLAIVVALDRSGSMAMPTPDGRPKIELADLATAEVAQHARADGPVRLHRRRHRPARDRAALRRGGHAIPMRRQDPADRLSRGAESSSTRRWCRRAT